ncbi:MAG: hypothetical protein ABF289_17370, partial [Clostridiales bacterium]
NLEEVDIDEYISLDVKIQQQWFYLYCLDKILPQNLNIFDSNLTLKELKFKKCELDILENQLKYIDDSGQTGRIEIIQNALIETSKIMHLLNTYKQKLNSYIEIMSIQDN